MTIRMVKHSDNSAELKPEGRIDSSNAADVQEVLLKTAEEYSEIKLNLSKLEYISSAGLRALLSLHKVLMRKNGRLTISHVSQSIREVFELTGFLNSLNIVD